MDDNVTDKPKEKRPRHQRSSLFWPLMFILLGIIFLLNNLNVISGNAWDLIIQLWPILFIALGLDSLWRREGVAGPVFWIGLGVALLLNNYGLLGWNVWEMLLTMWPLLLVAIGLDLAFGRRSMTGGILAGIVMIGLLAGVIWYFNSSSAISRATIETISQPVGDAAQASIQLSPAVGWINLSPMEDSNDLVAGQIYLWKGEQLFQNYQVKGSDGIYELRTESLGFMYPTGRRGNVGWQLKLTPDIPLDISIEFGLGEMDLDFTSLQIEDLTANYALGNMVVHLPETGKFSASLEGAIGRIEVVVPEGMAVRIRTDTGIASVQVPKGWEISQGNYSSPNFAGSSNQVNLSIHQAIGLVTVR